MHRLSSILTGKEEKGKNAQAISEGAGRRFTVFEFTMKGVTTMAERLYDWAVIEIIPNRK